MKLYAGIDLYSYNNYLGIIDNKEKRVYKKKLVNDLDEVLKALKPYRKDIEGIVVESTFNWYWLIDGASYEAIKYYCIKALLLSRLQEFQQ